jgi:hypothetical protein
MLFRSHVGAKKKLPSKNSHKVVYCRDWGHRLRFAKSYAVMMRDERLCARGWILFEAGIHG